MNIIVAVLLDEDLASQIGKKGVEGSITFYNRKSDKDIIVAIAPTSITEKFGSLANSLLMCEQVVISTKNVDRLFGEVLVAATLIKKRIILTKDSDVSSITSSINAKDMIFADKSEVLNLISTFKPKAEQLDGCRVEIDRAFNVKGTGTVLLGVVTRGMVKKHSKLFTKDGIEVQVRSIQCQDDDVDEAEVGSRVGLALKGIESEQIHKGDILSDKQIAAVALVKAKLTLSAFAKEKIESGRQYQIYCGFNSGSCMVKDFDGDVATLDLDKAMQIEPNDAIMLSRDVPPRIFACGSIL